MEGESRLRQAEREREEEGTLKTKADKGRGGDQGDAGKGITVKRGDEKEKR